MHKILLFALGALLEVAAGLAAVAYWPSDSLTNATPRLVSEIQRVDRSNIDQLAAVMEGHH